MKKNHKVVFIFLILIFLVTLFIVIYTPNTCIKENEVASDSTPFEVIASTEDIVSTVQDIYSDELVSTEAIFSTTEPGTEASTSNEVVLADSSSKASIPDEVILADSNVEASIPDEVEIRDNNFYSAELTQPIIDRIYGLSYKVYCPVPYDSLRYVSILYYDFNGEIQTGELICNKSIANDFVDIFKDLYDAHYPLEHVHLVDEYEADDTLSMLANNTSCFNYRVVDGTTNISKHGLGLAIDVNPFYNPYIKTNSDGSLYISPAGSEMYADRSLDFPHKIDENDLCYRLFTAHGFKWGGHYKTIKDYQHFYKEK